MAKRGIDFPGLVKRGIADTPDGFRAQTVNGTALSVGEGWNKRQPFSRPQVSPGGAWQPTGNRTGE